MASYWVWVTCATKAAVLKICSELIIRGYKVGSLSDNPALFCLEGEVSCVGALDVECPTEKEAAAVTDDVEEIVRLAGVMVHSVVTLGPLGLNIAASWRGSNIHLSEVRVPEVPTIYERLDSVAGPETPADASRGKDEAR